MHNIDLSRYDFDSATNEIKLKNFTELCTWAEWQDYFNQHNDVESHVRITRTDKKGIIIHQELIKFPLETFADDVLLGFNSKKPLLGAAEVYTVPLAGEVEVPDNARYEKEELSSSPLEEIVEEVQSEPVTEKTAATQMLESLMAQKTPSKPSDLNKASEVTEVQVKVLNDDERHERVVNLAAGLETDDFRSEVTEKDIPEVLVEEVPSESEPNRAEDNDGKTVLNTTDDVDDTRGEVGQSVTESNLYENEIEESIHTFKQHLDIVVGRHQQEIERATESANDLISSFVALGSGLMEGVITYDQIGREMADKGREIQKIGQHIANQEKKIAKIASLNKEIDKVLQSEE